jgi:pimeloyl-ACP methyl ester carboxylesterase
VAEKKVVVFEWGEGPSVWLVHGWAGRATQFYKIKDALVEIGYHVIGFDAPAHGISSGKQTSIVEFGETLRKIHAIYGDPKAYIGHSFGGIVGFYAHFSGIEIGRFVSIGAPVKSKEIMIEFLQRLSLTKRSYPGFNTAFKKRFGFELDAYSIQTWIKTSKPKHGLIIHDVEDLDAPIHHSYALREMLPDYEYYYTRGLGHNRILGDPVVIEKVIHYIQKEEIPIEQIKNPGKS